MHLPDAVCLFVYMSCMALHASHNTYIPTVVLLYTTSNKISMKHSFVRN